jgi:hypothetical protein
VYGLASLPDPETKTVVVALAGAAASKRIAIPNPTSRCTINTSPTVIKTDWYEETMGG